MENINLFCDIESPSYLIFSPSVPEFVYYSHIPVFILALFVAVFMFRAKNRSTAHWILIWTIIPFLVWVLLDSVFWASNRGDVIMFVWSSIILIEPMIYAGIFILHHYFVYDRFLKPKYIMLITLLFAPLFLFVSTKLTLKSFDVESCLAVEGFISLYYTYAIEFIFILLIFFNTVWALKYFFSERKRREVAYLSIGILFFIVVFTAGNMIGSFTSNWQIGQLGLLGMPIFLGVLAYSIVKFQTFQIKVIAPQVLVVSIWFLLLSTLFVTEVSNAKLIIGATLVLLTLMGYILIKSVKREIQHREEIQKLVGKLTKVNNRLRELDKEKSEFVSIASHQLRSPLTAIGGYVSLLRDGSFGKMPEKACEPLERIYTSTQNMSLSIEEYLNVSRIESGSMKYNKVDFNLSEQAEHVCDDLRSMALKKGLLLFFRTNLQSYPTVHADQGKVVQSVHNLVNNAIKYTEKGTITVYVHDDKASKKIFLEVIDTGIGMNEKALENIFQKFERADNAHKSNIQGTGLGLYMALKIVEAMGGTITAYSEGEGKGSRFVLELPLVV